MSLYGPVHKVLKRSAYAIKPPMNAHADITNWAKGHFAGSLLNILISTKLVCAYLINV